MENNSYKTKVTCDNCNFVGDVDIEKGTKVSDSSCPDCGCKELKLKSEPKNIRIRPMTQNYR